MSRRAYRTMLTQAHLTAWARGYAHSWFNQRTNKWETIRGR